MATLQPELNAGLENMGTGSIGQAASHGIARSVALTFGTNFFIAAVALVSGPLAARLLGPGGRGELAAVQNIYWLVSYASLLGLAEGTLFFVARRPQRSAQTLVTALLLVLAATPLSIYVGYKFVPLILKGQNSQTIWVAGACLLFIWVQSALGLAQFAIRGLNRIKDWNISRAVPALLWMSLLVALTVNGRASVSLVIFAYIAVLGLSGIVAFTLFFRKKQDYGPLRPDFALAKPLLKYGAPLVCASIPQTLNLRLDQLLIAGMLPASALGFYVVGVGWSGALTPLLTAIANVLFPQLAGSKSLDTSRILFGRVVRIGGTLAFTMGALLTAITPGVLPLLFGSAFRPSILAACVLVPASSISGMNIILEEGLRGLGNTWVIFSAEIAGLMATVISLIYLLPRMGIMGAGIGSVFGYSVTFLVLIFYAAKALEVGIWALLQPTGHDLKYIRTRFSAVIDRYKRGHGKEVES